MILEHQFLKSLSYRITGGIQKIKHHRTCSIIWWQVIMPNFARNIQSRGEPSNWVIHRWEKCTDLEFLPLLAEGEIVGKLWSQLRHSTFWCFCETWVTSPHRVRSRHSFRFAGIVDSNNNNKRLKNSLCQKIFWNIL